MARKLRVLGVVGLAGALALVVLHGAAQARVDELAADLGRYLLGVEGAREAEPVALQVNGLPLWLRSGVSQQPVAEVLDELERRCVDAAGLRDLLPAGARMHIPGPIGRGVLRRDDGSRGYVACLDPGQPLDRPQLIARLEAFTRTTDLAELGVLRFGWVEGDGSSTHYVAIDSAGALPLSQAFPSSGDAPGTDARGLPRPPGARRILSAGLASAAPGLTAYHAPAPAAPTAAGYVEALGAAGFRLSQPDPTQHAWLVRDGGAHYALTVAPDGDGSVVSLAALR